MMTTAFLSGIFGKVGGLILIGVLLALMPLPAAMDSKETFECKPWLHSCGCQCTI